MAVALVRAAAAAAAACPRPSRSASSPRCPKVRRRASPGAAWSAASCARRARSASRPSGGARSATKTEPHARLLPHRGRGGRRLLGVPRRPLRRATRSRRAGSCTGCSGERAWQEHVAALRRAAGRRPTSRSCAGPRTARSSSRRRRRWALARIAVTDRNTLAGVVRAHLAAKEVGLRLIVGARLDLQDAPSLLCLPRDRAGLRPAVAPALARPEARREGPVHALSRRRRAARRGPDLHRAAARRLGLARGCSAPADAEAPRAADHPVPRREHPSPSPVAGEGRSGVVRDVRGSRLRQRVLPLALTLSPCKRHGERGRRPSKRSCGASKRRWATARSISRRATPIAATTARASRRSPRSRERCGTPLVATNDVLYHAPAPPPAAGRADLRAREARRSPRPACGSKPTPSGI